MWGLSQKEKDQRLSRAFWHESVNDVKEALQKGGNPNAKVAEGMFPVIWAARRYQTDSVELLQTLIEAGADLNIKDGSDSAVSCAIERNNLSFLNMLADAGVDLSAPTGSVKSATAYAIMRQSWNLVDALITRGVAARAYPEQEGGPTLLMTLLEKDAPTYILEKIIDTQDVNAVAGRRTALSIAVSNGKTAAVDYLLSKPGIDVNQEYATGRNVLQAAISGRHSDIGLKLVEHGADIFAKFHNGHDALSFAAMKGDVTIMRAVLKRANELNRKAELRLDAALMLAAENGHGQIVNILSREGAQLDQADENGQTPAIKAAINGHTSTLKTLARLEADMLKADKNGMPPFEHAIAKNQEEAKAYLETLQPGYVVPPPPPPPVDPNRFVKTSNTTLDVREKGLTMTFNFWTQQLIYRDPEKSGTMVVQNFADVQRTEAIIEAYETLKRLGGNPPEPVRAADKPATLKIK